mgnify:CR=1 FL=1
MYGPTPSLWTLPEEETSEKTPEKQEFDEPAPYIAPNGTLMLPFGEPNYYGLRRDFCKFRLDFYKLRLGRSQFLFLPTFRKIVETRACKFHQVQPKLMPKPASESLSESSQGSARGHLHSSSQAWHTLQISEFSIILHSVGFSRVVWTPFPRLVDGCTFLQLRPNDAQWNV